MTGTIYGVFNRTGKRCLYVGQSTRPWLRFKAHLSKGPMSGISAKYRVLEPNVSLSKLSTREGFWIKKLRKEGHPLRNKVSNPPQVERATLPAYQIGKRQFPSLTSVCEYLRCSLPYVAKWRKRTTWGSSFFVPAVSDQPSGVATEIQVLR